MTDSDSSGSTARARMTLRSDTKKKWHERTPQGFNPDEWETVLTFYKAMDEDAVHTEFLSQWQQFQTEVEKETALEEREVQLLERRATRIKLLNALFPTHFHDHEIEKFQIIKTQAKDIRQRLTEAQALEAEALAAEAQNTEAIDAQEEAIEVQEEPLDSEKVVEEGDTSKNEESQNQQPLTEEQSVDNIVRFLRANPTALQAFNKKVASMDTQISSPQMPSTSKDTTPIMKQSQSRIPQYTPPQATPQKESAQIVVPSPILSGSTGRKSTFQSGEDFLDNIRLNEKKAKTPHIDSHSNEPSTSTSKTHMEQIQEAPTGPMSKLEQMMMIQIQLNSQQNERQEKLLTALVQGQIGSKKASTALKLPQVEIKKFTGEKMEFFKWWDRFKAIVDQNTSLDDEGKMLLLQQSMNLEAGKIVWGASPENMTYEEALKKIFKKFCDPSLMVDSYTEQILSQQMPTSTTDYKGMRSVIDNTTKALNCLGRFGVHSDVVSAGAMREFRRKFPVGLIDAIALKYDCKLATLTLTEFIEKLDRYVSILEESRDHRALIPSSSSIPGSNGSQVPRTTMTGAGRRDEPPRPAPRTGPRPAPRTLFPCIFCDAPAGKHTWRNCPYTVDPRERYRVFVGLKRCTCCGSPIHHYTDCKSIKYCTVRDSQGVECGRKHHVSLHEHFVHDRRPQGGNQRQSQRRPDEGNNAPQSRQPRASTRTTNAGHASTQEGSQQSGGDPQPSQSNGTGTTGFSYIGDKEALLPVVTGTLSHPQKPKRKQSANVYLDEGSNVSYVTSNMATALGLPIKAHVPYVIKSLGVTNTRTYPVTQVRVQGKGGQCLVECVITDKIMDELNIRGSKEATKAFPHWKFPIDNADDTFKVDILIGTNSLRYVRTDKIDYAGDDLEARMTIFGPYIIGQSGYRGGVKHNEESITMANMAKPSKYHLSAEAERMVDMIDLEDEDKLRKLTFSEDHFTEREDKDSTDEDLLKKLHEGTRKVKTETGEILYEVPMLWRSPEAKAKLKPNFDLSISCLHRLFDQLEKKGTVEQANKLVNEAIKNGFYEEVPTDAKSGHYIPTFLVNNPNSTSTPIRHVIAGNLGNPPINDCLETGPSMIADLRMLLRRFRCHKTAIVGDISKAFNRMVVRQEDRDYFKLLWFKDGDRKQLITLRIARIPFGTCLAPFQLFGTLLKHLSEHEHEEAKSLIDTFYSDNLVTSIDGDAVRFTQDAVAILNDGGFSLRKFSTNSKELETNLLEKGLLNTAEMDTTRVLGSIWTMETDTMSFPKPPSPPERLTRRKALQWLHGRFDPLGILEGLVMPGRALLASIWSKYEWDEPFSTEDKTKFDEIFQEITTAVQNLAINRLHNFDKERQIRLHVFADASKDWNGCLAYLSQDGKSELVGSKAKKPSKRLEPNLTIPKRELEALLLGAKMMVELRKTYKDIYPLLECHLYSDSQIVLWQLANDQKPHKAFVKNRVRLIKEMCGDVPTHYIITTENPADAVSRGLTAEEILDKESLFWTGPSIMHNSEIVPFKEAPDEIVAVAVTLAAVAEADKPSVFKLVDKSNTMKDMKRRLATLIRCTRKWQKKPPLDGAKLSKEVAIQLLKAEQAEAMPEVVQWLATKQGPRPSSCIHPQNLYLDGSGLVRCGGRLGKSNLPFESRYPIYYPTQSPLLELRVMEAHITALHAGPGITRSKLLCNLWIPKSTNLIRRIIKGCFNCNLASGPPYRWPQAPDLPEERVTVQPYTGAVGCDLTGAFNVMNGDEPVKVYICIFTDCGTRHMSVQVMDNMETGTFLQAFRRHCSIYGTPTKVISDQGTYFIKSSAVLGEELGEEWCNEIGEAMNRKGISWQFNPAGAPHFGGHYERLIGTLKGPLKRCIGRAVIDKQEFITLVAEAACVVNDRPLTCTTATNLQDRLEGVQMLTPNHLVFGNVKSPLPYGEASLEDLEEDPDFDEPNDEDINRQWRRLANRLNKFKLRFQEEYLLYLRNRHHNDHHNDPVQVPKIGKDDLVLVAKDNVKRSLWDMARVIETLPGSDGQVRAVRLQTKNGETTRPIVKLYPLLQAKEPEQEEIQEEAQGQPDDDPIVDVNNAPLAAPVPAPRSRPQRAAKTAGREKVRMWTSDG